MQGCAAPERCGPLRSIRVRRRHAQGPGFGVGSLPKGSALLFLRLWFQKNFLQPFSSGAFRHAALPSLGKNPSVPADAETLRFIDTLQLRPPEADWGAAWCLHALQSWDAASSLQ